MKALLYVVSLLLSLPNLIAGTASLLLKHTFATRNPLQIITDFLFQVVWGLPLAAVLFVLLLVLGVFSTTRPYAALFAFVLNATALVFVLSRLGLPSDFDKGVFFLPNPPGADRIRMDCLPMLCTATFRYLITDNR